jgi:hypothetical protein
VEREAPTRWLVVSLRLPLSGAAPPPSSPSHRRRPKLPTRGSHPRHRQPNRAGRTSLAATARPRPLEIRPPSVEQARQCCDHQSQHAQAPLPSQSLPPSSRVWPHATPLEPRSSAELAARASLSLHLRATPPVPRPLLRHQDASPCGSRCRVVSPYPGCEIQPEREMDRVRDDGAHCDTRREESEGKR